MNTDRLNDAQIIKSWEKNALAWTVAVREGQIESRKQITDRAIVDAILNCQPSSVLDLGCGEGWLVRELAARKITALGTDAVPAQIAAAQHFGSGDFRAISYEDISAGKLKVSVDVVVSNFSLLGKESVEGIFKAVPSLLNASGSFIVQTLHPVLVCGDFPYRDGWRDGSWAGFSKDFTEPAPWYFRTLESWIKLFVVSGFRLQEVREPLHPKTQTPASAIFIGDKAS
ncbi:MAG: class I SAM-dependent methyltransferase [Oscillatoriaceae cyanobacterium Prado104]|jgi:2-polyprenyl-3-methyl-5-hydroxy-6-metoxy-1,4-benzoquinol methylase|nr:class I SAM-dependent methyltransferase [Oscillatoriaceae cyanobacterium Prado104]